MSVFMLRLAILLFLGSLALVRKAQDEFYNNGEENPLRGLFQFQSGSIANMKDSFDDGNIQKVIGILQGNIKQWSFIESQLLEPNVNLGMPEIFIPLKHLTTTLEILGNIFFAQNDLLAAQQSLERACPLMELLPASALAEDEFSSAAAAQQSQAQGQGQGQGDGGDSAAAGGSYLWFGGAANGDGGAGFNPMPAIQPRSMADNGGYATGCFALLREVYAKLYGTAPGTATVPDLQESSDETDQPDIILTDDQQPEDITQSPQTSTVQDSSRLGPPLRNTGGVNGYLLPNGRPREYNLKYVLSQRQQRQQMKQKPPGRRNISAGTMKLTGEAEGDGARSTKVSGAKLSMSAATAGSAYREKSAAASRAHRRRDHDLLMTDPADQELYGSAGAGYDVESKLQELRSPYEHLRSELGRGAGAGPSRGHAGPGSSPSSEDVSSDDRDRPVGRTSTAAGRGGAGLGLSGPVDPEKGGARVRGFEGSALNSISGEAITQPGVSTSIIADDLEILLRRFVRASKKGRRELAQQAAKYFDELDINFPNMDYNEYAANMDVGQAYLEVLSRAAEEGFGFVGTELSSWRSEADSAAESRAEEGASAEGAAVEASGARAGRQGKPKLSSKRLQPSAGELSDDALEEQYGLKLGADGKPRPKKSSSKRKSASPKLSMAEKNRLLVLYAFDIVHTDPTDLFDVGLGFNRGIKDNDRSRKRDQPFPGGDGAAATAEGLGEAADFLRSASKGDLDAILLSAGDDAHKRLFPFDPFGGSSGEGGGHQRRTQRLTEQHLLLLQEGGAEAYLASKSAAVREKAAAAAAGGGAAKGGKRRRQRQQAVGGEGEYSVSSDGSTSADGGASRIQHGALKGDNERENAEYYDEAAGATVGLMSASSLRASVPSLGSDGADWTLSLFLLFMLLTGAVVYSANQEAARKRMTAGRNRLRQGGSSALGGAGGKKGGLSWLNGTSVVDFMYAQLGGVGGAPGANATADWDDSASAPTPSESERASSTNSAVPPTTSTGSSLFSNASTSLHSLLGSLGRGTAQDASSAQAPATSAVAVTKGLGAGGAGGSVSSKAKKGKDVAAITSSGADNASAAKVAESPSKSVKGSMFRDLLSLMSPNETPLPTAATADSALKPDASGKRRDSPRTELPNEFATKPGVQVSVPSNALAVGGGKGKGKKNSAAPAVAAKPAQPPRPPPVAKSAPSTDSLTSVGSASSQSSSGSNDAADVALKQPVSLNNRRVSWAGLLPQSTTVVATGDSAAGGIAAFADSDKDGDWAEARKKGGRNKHTGSAASEEKDTQRVALSLKDSPLYRHAPVRPTPPVPPQRPVPAPSAGGFLGARPNGNGNGSASAVSRYPASQQPAVKVTNSPRTPTGTVPASAPSQPTVNPSSGSAAPAAAPSPGAVKSRVLYDLSEAKMLAEQLGGWSISGAAADSPHGEKTAGGGVRAGGNPPGLPRAGGVDLHLHSSPRTAQATSTSSAASPASAAGASTSAFGFSQLDLSGGAGYNNASALWSAVSSSGSGFAVNSALYGTGNTAATLGALTVPSSSADELYVGDFEPSGYLGGLVDFLDASPRSSLPSHAQKATSLGASGTGAYDFSDVAEYGAQYDAAGAADAYYGDETNGYYFQQAEGYYAQYDESGAGVYDTTSTAYSGYGAAEEEDEWERAQRSANYGKSAAEQDLSAANITMEASSLYGLSPDAPSFKPSQQRARYDDPLLQSLSSQFLARDPQLQQSAPSSLFGAQLFGGQSLGAPAATPAPTANDSLAAFNSDEFYESVFVDSILGGEDQRGALAFDDF